MTGSALLMRSLFHFWRTNLGVALGVAVATAVITGALLVGDAMRYTLQRTADARLSLVEQAVIGGDRFFTDDLAADLSSESAGVIALRGVLSTPDGRVAVPEVNVYGVDESFAVVVPGPINPTGNEGFVNDALHARLGGVDRDGADLILRIPEPTALPLDAALTNASEPAIAVRLRLGGALSDDQGARFSLQAQQRAPLNLFVNRRWLAEQIGVEGRVNLALSARKPDAIAPTLSDLSLSLDKRSSGLQSLTTPRVFIDASIEDDLADLPGTRLLTYLVNTIAMADRQSPYAMVTAADDLGNLNLADDEIAINRWLADDLNADVGDRVSLTYYLPDAGDRLIETTVQLTVARIVPLEGAFADRTLTPDFPGLAEADTLSRWDAGPAIDRRRIRDKDEAYWDDHRATPKAFVNLATGQRLWSNRFGTLTAIRFDPSIDEADLLNRIDPSRLGFASVDLKTQAREAAAGTVDFGQLFLSLSGFILIAAFVLTATLFAMSAEQRARQLGTLMALGLTRRQVIRLILGEGAVLGGLGAAAGLVGGVAYAYAVTGALSGTWSGAVAGSPVYFHLTAVSLVAGPMSALAVSLLSMAWAVRGLLKRQARALLAGGVGRVSDRPRVAAWAWLVLAGPLVAVTLALPRGGTGIVAALIGFGRGAGLLAALLCMMLAVLAWLSSRRSATASRLPYGLSSRLLAARNLVRRRGRTVAAVVTLSCGVFLVLAVAGFRLGLSDDPAARSSGTGGFTLLVETSQPVRYDLNTELGRDHYALDVDELPPGSVVSLRMNDGDDASCLNLNQTPTPRVLGVDPDELARRDAFTFFNLTGEPTTWTALEYEQQHDGQQDQAIPAIADANTAQWALKLAVGDTMTLADGRGRPYTVRLVATIENTVLQGSLIIDESAFTRLYPDTSGYRMLLIDPVANQSADDVASLLSEVMVDEGPVITPTTERLMEYSTVQNTYLSVFQSLGGLGVVLGALGLGVIAARNLLERRAELALMSAVGLSRARIVTLALIEHGLILAMGVGFGFASAWAGTIHTAQAALWTQAATRWTLAAIVVAGVFAIAIGVRPVFSRRLIAALRSD